MADTPTTPAQPDASTPSAEPDAEAIIAELTAPAPEAAEAESPKAEPPKEGKPPTEEPPAPPPAVTEDPSVKGALQVIAQREQELLRRQQELENQQRELSGVDEKVKSFNATREEFLRDPAGFADRFDLDESQVLQLAQSLYYKALGDKAPKEHRAEALARRAQFESKSLERKVQELEQKFQQQLQERDRAAQEAQYLSQLGSFAASYEDAPYLQRLAKQDPSRAADAMYRVVKAQHEKDQTILSNEQAARLVDEAIKEELTGYTSVFGDLIAPSQPSNSSAPSSQADPLTPNDTASQSAPVNLDELPEEEMVEEAIKLALADGRKAAEAGH